MHKPESFHCFCRRSFWFCLGSCTSLLQTSYEYSTHLWSQTKLGSNNQEELKTKCFSSRLPCFTTYGCVLTSKAGRLPSPHDLLKARTATLLGISARQGRCPRVSSPRLSPRDVFLRRSHDAALLKTRRRGSESGTTCPQTSAARQYNQDENSIRTVGLIGLIRLRGVDGGRVNTPGIAGAAGRCLPRAVGAVPRSSVIRCARNNARCQLMGLAGSEDSSSGTRILLRCLMSAEKGGEDIRRVQNRRKPDEDDDIVGDVLSFCAS